MIVLGIDPSTDVTGVALVEMPEIGEAKVLLYGSFDATAAMKEKCKSVKGKKVSAIGARILRIAWTRRQIICWLEIMLLNIDLVAYELGGGPGTQSDQAGDMALGCYLTIGSILGLPIEGVMRGSACSVAGAHHVYREKAGSTSREKAEKRARLKAAVIAGINQRCGLELDESQDAEADAIAIAIAAGEAAWREQKVQKAAAAQGTLKLRRSPAKKEVAV